MSRPNKIVALCHHKSQAWSFFLFYFYQEGGLPAKNDWLHFGQIPLVVGLFSFRFFFVVIVLRPSFSQEAMALAEHSRQAACRLAVKEAGQTLAWVPSSASPINFLKKGPSSQCAGFPSSVIIPSSSSSKAWSLSKARSVKKDEDDSDDDMKLRTMKQVSQRPSQKTPRCTPHTVQQKCKELL